MENLSDYSIQDAYHLFNGKYFGGKLPDIPVLWKKYLVKKGWIGITVGGKEQAKEIHLNPYYRRSSSVWGRTLFHEMVHVEQWSIPAKQCHGRAFEKRMKQLAARGAFKGMW